MNCMYNVINMLNFVTIYFVNELLVELIHFYSRILQGFKVSPKSPPDEGRRSIVLQIDETYLGKG